MDAFDLATLLARRPPAERASLELLRWASLSLSLFTLKAGSVDPQQPHSEDEVYYVLRGRARFRAGERDVAVQPGTVLAVEAGVAHRFYDLLEDLETLVIFAPAKGTQAAAGGSRTEMRRQDRAQDDAWIREMLRRAPFGFLATVAGGQPFINSNLFVYDEASHCLYLHTAREGRTRTNVATDARVCFTVAEMGRLLPADTALEMSVEYAGVVIFGRARFVEDMEEARRALQLLLDKYVPHLRPGEHYRAITDEELSRTSVYGIAIEEWSGKRKQAPPDFLGAFFYGEPPATEP